MNSVDLIGRLTKDPEVRWTKDGRAVARFSVAINRGRDRDGNDLGADFPNVVVFGKQAENCEKYLAKGRLVGISGRLQTGSYVNKDGNRIYTTDVVAQRVEFLSWGKDSNTQNGQNGQQGGFNAQTEQSYQSSENFDERTQQTAPAGFEPIDDEDIPF